MAPSKKLAVVVGHQVARTQMDWCLLHERERTARSDFTRGNRGCRFFPGPACGGIHQLTVGGEGKRPCSRQWQLLHHFEQTILLVDRKHREGIASSDVQTLLSVSRIPIAWRRIRVGHGVEYGCQPPACLARQVTVVACRDRLLLQRIMRYVIEFAVSVEFESLITSEANLAKLIFVPTRPRIVMTKHPRTW